MFGRKGFTRKATPGSLVVLPISVWLSLCEASQFLNGFAFFLSRALLAKHKVISGMERSLKASTEISIFQGNRRRLVPEFEHIVSMFCFK